MHVWMVGGPNSLTRLEWALKFSGVWCWYETKSGHQQEISLRAHSLLTFLGSLVEG